MARIIIETNKCKGCSLCVTACPKKLITLNAGKVNAIGYNPAEVVDSSNCTGCTLCAVMCPDCAIQVLK